MNVASLIQSVSVVFWLVLVGVIVLVVLRASRNNPIKRGGLLILAAFVVASVVSVVSMGLVFIAPTERGIVVTAYAPGYREQALEPGVHWVVPFVESVTVYPISRQTYTMSIAPSEGAIQGDDSITARTADGQEVFVDASVIFEIDPQKIIQIHIQWQDRYVELVRAQSRGIIRDSISKYRVEEVYANKRDLMVKEVSNTLKTKLAENGLLMVDFVLRNITFSKEYSTSIEQKQISEQQAQQAKFIVEQKRQEAEQARQIAQGQADAAVIKSKGDAEARVIQADAEAKALDLIARAIRDNPNLLNYQYVSKLSPSITTILVPSNSPFILPFPQTNGITTTP